MTVRQADMPASDADRRVLEAVRQQQGLETLDQAAEFVLRRHLRKGIGRMGTPRGPRPVGRR
ncbi:hypothetical protein [Kushneria indalinina]|uniref:Uncharacterized protein n=1 Tax=Kushneria indalinina DSM 14324 TaxID=1122140 RepID=A0A3D9DVW0_9GAMM|nr:hypothetical protein [Kushneria indalinina]REC94902.1 hypothetical protein C8D72_1731 [Kushneria indalinina DSM 14324]